MKNTAISAVVPVYNEAGSIAALCEEVRRELAALKQPYEILVVNDGSTDGSLAVLEDIENITILDLNRNYGQATALDAGFKAAQGALVVSLDGDGQNDPRDIARLIAVLRTQGLDMVAGWRRKRQDPRDVRILTRIGRLLRSRFIADGVHDSGCTLRVYTREAAKSLDIGGEMHRYIPALLRWKGFRIGELEVNHRPRQNGHSKYGPGKALRGFIDLIYIWFIYKYSQRALHLFGYLSLTSFALAIISGAWTLFNYLRLGIHFARDVWLVVSAFFLLAAFLFFSFGIVIDLLLRILLNTSPYEKRYYVREVIKT